MFRSLWACRSAITTKITPTEGGLAPTLKGKGLMGKSVEEIMKSLKIVRNKPVPAVVVSAGLMDKTIKVAVQRWALPHRIYRRDGGKHLAVTRLLVHDEENLCRPGDEILVQKSRPYSKFKHHIVYMMIRKERGREYLESHPEYQFLSRSDLRKVEERQHRVT